MKVLFHELKSDKSKEEHIQKLFKITHVLRRDKIQSSQSSIINLQNDYPFFEKGKWVRVTSYKLLKYCNKTYIIHWSAALDFVFHK